MSYLTYCWSPLHAQTGQLIRCQAHEEEEEEEKVGALGRMFKHYKIKTFRIPIELETVTEIRNRDQTEKLPFFKNHLYARHSLR